jgi:hypothetical protein
MFPAEGRLDIYWRHADEPQETVFMTSRFEWDAGATINSLVNPYAESETERDTGAE